MRGAPDSAPQSLILPSPPIRFKAGRFSASKGAEVFRTERFGFSCGVVSIADCVDFFTELLECLVCNDPDSEVRRIARDSTVRIKSRRIRYPNRQDTPAAIS